MQLQHNTRRLRVQRRRRGVSRPTGTKTMWDQHLLHRENRYLENTRHYECDTRRVRCSQRRLGRFTQTSSRVQTRKSEHATPHRIRRWQIQAAPVQTTDSRLPIEQTKTLLYYKVEYRDQTAPRNRWFSLSVA